MLILVGLVLIFAAVLGGFALERGNLLVLLQPAELLIIGGAAIGILLVSNPPSTIVGIIRCVLGLFRPSPYNRAYYLTTLKMFHDVFSYHRKVGDLELEKDIEDPAHSKLFQAYRSFLHDAHAFRFFCDSFRISIAAGLQAHEVDRIMRLDLDSHRRDGDRPVNALAALADALPGLGIVAAVLGVVLTMQSLGGPAAEVGQKVAAALVGTFLGILMCYGVAGPLASHLESHNERRMEYLQVIRTATVSYMAGGSPLVAAECARRSIASEFRPSFDEMEHALRHSERIESAA